MFDLGVLDVIISIVVVLLVLSLIFQSIQSLLKKLLKLKSSVVFDSMEDLFKHIDTQALVSVSPKELVTQSQRNLNKLGRVSSGSRLVHRRNDEYKQTYFIKHSLGTNKIGRHDRAKKVQTI